MNTMERSKNARDFAKEWSGSDYKEKGNVGKFWIELLEQIFGITNASKDIEREVSVPNMKDSTDFIDVYIPSTRVLIEQKAPYLSLDKPEQRSFGDVTPFEQAKHYDDNLPLPKKAKWIITCNFHEFWIYDMATSGTKPKPTRVLLSDLWRYYYQLDFLVDPTRQDIKKETKVSVKACTIINDIYHQLLDQYSNPDDPQVLKDVNKICVRLVFCLYADDSGIFGHHEMFHDYMQSVPAPYWNVMLGRLFKVLDTPINERKPDQLDAKIAKFPYVNGGMFADDPAEHVEIPNFTSSISTLILNAGDNFDWSQISPTIFGALFESTLNPEERHTNGMHYTSVQNIHKVIDPLFLDKLRHQLNVIKTKYKDTRSIHAHAKAFQNHLASLTFFDPACGSGNFLTETYLCLRKLENEAIELQLGDNGYFNTELLGTKQLIKVSIHQFYGIEINDFAVSVAKTAMWIAESQMAQETQDIIQQPIVFLPLKSNPNIIEANALEMDWSKLISPSDLNYIISNPPFVSEYKNKDQKRDMKATLKGFKNIGQLDFVSAWYKKSADMMNLNPDIDTILVSTNSITQGQQVNLLWKPLIQKYKLHINFAYRSFYWSSSVKSSALVVCVIIEFSKHNRSTKVLYDKDGNPHRVSHINPYLRDLPDIFIDSRTTPLCNVKQIRKGSQPTDHGYLSKFKAADVEDIESKYPSTKKMFKRLVGANELLNHKQRWCLWLRGVSPSAWLHIALIRQDVQQVKTFRAKSSKKATRKCASTPYLFQEIRQPKQDYLMIPQITSQTRTYIPMAFLSKDIIVNNKGLAISGASIYDFGILTSIVHREWIKLTSGRYGPSFEYSPKLTYNTFPWPSAGKGSVDRITESAKEILYIRRKYQKATLSELYNPLSMPPDLQKAHHANDKAVLQAYGLKSTASKAEIITKLLIMYSALVKSK